MDEFGVALIVMLIGIFGSRIIHLKAQEKLNDQQKADLVTISNKDQITMIVVMMFIIIAFLLVSFNHWMDFNLALGLYLLLMFPLIIYNTVKIYRKMQELQFPENFVKLYTLAVGLRLFSSMAFFLILLLK